MRQLTWWSRVACVLALGCLCPLPLAAATATVTVSPTPSETPSVSPSPTVTQTAVCGSTFGCPTCSYGSGAGFPNTRFVATQFSLPVSGTVNSVSVYYTSTTGNRFRVGVYTDNGGVPGTLMVQSGDNTTVNGWNSVDVNPTYLDAGTYWLAELSEQGRVEWDNDLMGYGALMAIDYTYGAMPSQAPPPNGGLAYTGDVGFMYASYCPGPPIYYTATPTMTATVTPIEYLGSGGLGKAAFGPVPARQGEAVCLYLPKPAQSSSWEVYNLLGQRVAALSFDNLAAGCWDTSAVAPGFYLIRAQVDYVDGSSQTLLQKVVVLK